MTRQATACAAVAVACLATLLARGLVVAQAPPAVEVGRFSAPTRPDELPSGWEPLTFKRIERHTRYTVVPEADRFVLRAESQASASALYRPLDLPCRAYPVLSWRWKVDNVLVKADARTRAGDDYPARVYVAFRYDPAAATLWERAKYGFYRALYGQYPPRAVVNYVWDNRLPVGTMLPNAYTDRARMIVLQSGPERVGRWVEERRDVCQDYREAVGGEPPPIAGVAVMTDTDDTGERAVAYYDAITLRPRE